VCTITTGPITDNGKTTGLTTARQAIAKIGQVLERAKGIEPSYAAWEGFSRPNNFN
jgi:hypothetical protein